MGFIAGLLGGKSKKTASTVASGLSLQSSSYGRPVPIIYGTTRAAANLIWYGDFSPIAQSSSAGAGGKGGVGGGGGGKGGGGATSYVYQASFQFALCEGPIQGVGNVYVNKQVVSTASLGLSVFTGTYPQTAWGYLVSTHGSISETDTIPGSPYRVTVANAATFLQDYGVVGPFAGSVFTLVPGSPGANQYSVATNSANTQVTYTFSSANAGANVIISYQQGGIGSDQTEETIPSSGPYTVTINARNAQDLGVILGNAAYTKVGGSPGANQYSVSNGVYTFNSANSGSQVTISYSAASQNPPFQALGYNGIGHIDASAYQLGNSPQLPNHNFEIKGVFSTSLAGIGVGDADPSLVAADLLTNTHYGIGFPSARLGSLSTYQAYCIANGLWISVAYTDQQAASAMLDEIARATNSEWVWSAGVLFLVPYGDQSVTANGYTYTAPSAPLYDLTDDDFTALNGSTAAASATATDGPVLLTRKRPADRLNSIKVEYLDRSNNYNPAVVEAKDQAFINLYGLRQNAATAAHLFADGNAARLSSQLLLNRQGVANVYSFQLDQRYVVLDPMDIVTITDSSLGLNRQWVRIVEVTENDDGTISVVAEEYLAGTGSAPQYSFQAGQGFAADYNGSPGNANAPVAFEPPVQITNTGLEVWLAISGGANWGGCDVYASTDGDTYKKLGRVTGSCRQGVLTQDLPPHADPDTTDTLSVNLSQSQGILISGTQADADNLHTLCYVGGELLSFQTAQLTSPYTYSLTYLRRGAYGTTITDHTAGTKFARLDDGVFSVPYDKGQIGQTIFFKLVGFNVYGGGQQSISTVSPYSYTIAGPPLPGQVQNFQAHQQGNTMAFNWTDLEIDSGLKGYDIAFAPQGTTDWTHFTLLTEAHRGTEMTNASVPPGTWTFAIRARDIADQLGPMATYDATMTNANTVIASLTEEPSWPYSYGFGLSAFVIHPSGVLVPTGNYTCDQYTRISPPATPVLSQVASGSLTGATYYVKLTCVGTYGETTPSAEASLAVSANNVPYVTSPAFPSGGNPDGYLGYNVYLATSSGAETLQNSAPIPFSQDWQLPDTGLTSGVTPPTRNTTGWEVFDIFVPDPSITDQTGHQPAHFYGQILDTGFDATCRVWTTYKAAPGPGQGAAGEMDISVGIAAWTSAGSDPGIDPVPAWTIGNVLMRYVRPQIDYTIATDGTPSKRLNPGTVCYFSDLSITVDNPNSVQQGNGVTIAPGGSTITFPNQYHSAPSVTAQVIGSAALYATVSSVTTTSCVINVWNGSGTSVGGSVNWTSTGA